jgi:hypothetical protein
MLFRALDVDYVQWRAVSRTLLKSDFRMPLAHAPSALARWGGLAGMAAILGLFGLGAALIVVMNPRVLLTGTLALTYLSVMLATTLLTQHGTTMLSTADHAILGARPVSSRTFFAIRLTNVLFHALLLTSLMAYPVIAAYGLAHGRHALRAAASAAAIYAWAVTVALIVVASYTTLLRIAGPARFHRAVGYLQLIAGFMAYFGLLVSGRLAGQAAAAEATMPDAWWLVLLPPAWFASYLELAVGTANSTTSIRWALSLAVPGVLVYALRNKLGADYARQLAELPSAAPAERTAAVRTPFFRRGEGRAAAILVLAHFRHDLRVRMGILGIVPLILVYMVIGVRDGSFDLVALAVLLFPALLTQYFASTDAYLASWIYHAAPADTGRLVVALKNVAVAYFLLPFLVLVAAVFSWRFADVGRGLVHTAMLGLVGHIALQGSAIISPRLPFALPPDKLRGNATLMGWMLLVILGGQMALVALDRWVYVSRLRTVAALAVLGVLTLALDRTLAWRARAVRG